MLSFRGVNFSPSKIYCLENEGNKETLSSYGTKFAFQKNFFNWNGESIYSAQL